MSGMSQPQLQHDEYLSSLAALPPQTLYTVNEMGDVRVLAVVKLSTLLPRLSPSHVDLRGDVDRVVPEIVHWGRIAAIQKRVWTIREREFRTWKARFELTFRTPTPVADDGEGKVVFATKKDGWGQAGRINQEQVEANYRTTAEYAALSANLEAAEEAWLFADVVYRAYRSKQEVLMADVRRAGDGSLQRLSP